MEKHKKYVEEMMITFSKGKVDETGNEIPVAPEEAVGVDATPPEPQYTAVDVFDNSVNSLIRDFDPNGMVHVQTVDQLSPEESETEMNVQDNQIGFEFIDGKLHISIDGNDIYLSPDAISALKDYLNNMEESDSEQPKDDESESDDTETTEDEESSEETDEEPKEEDK